MNWKLAFVAAVAVAFCLLRAEMAVAPPAPLVLSVYTNGVRVPPGGTVSGVITLVAELPGAPTQPTAPRVFRP